MTCANCKWWHQSSNLAGWCCRPNVWPHVVFSTFSCADYKPKQDAGGEVKQ